MFLGLGIGNGMGGWGDRILEGRNGDGMGRIVLTTVATLLRTPNRVSFVLLLLFFEDS